MSDVEGGTILIGKTPVLSSPSTRAKLYQRAITVPSLSFTWRPRIPLAACSFARSRICRCRPGNLVSAIMRNWSFPVFTRRSQISSASARLSVGMVTSILSSPSGRIMISRVPDGSTRLSRFGTMSLAVVDWLPKLTSSDWMASRFSEPTMFTPPERSTPNLGGHLVPTNNAATRMQPKISDNLPAYSGIRNEEEIVLARKIASAKQAGNKISMNEPDSKNDVVVSS